MKESLQRIKELHQQGKISDEEYSNLIKSTAPHPVFQKLSFKILLNPFRYAKGLNALIAGFFVLLLLSFVASQSFIHFPTALSLKVINSKAQNLGFWYILFQNLLIVLSLTVFFYMGALIARVKNLRLVDFLGALFLSRIPYLVGTLLLILMAKFIPEILYIPPMMEKLSFSTAIIVATLITVPCLIWQCTHYYLALKQASGISRKWIWIIFIIGVLASEAITLNIHKRMVMPKVAVTKVDQDPKSQEAITFAKDWLALVDQKKYSASWEKASTTFKAALAKSQWVENIKAKETYGPVLSRKLLTTENFNEAGRGRYIRIIFESNYETSKKLFENVTLFYEKDQWTLSGYFIRP